MLVRSLLAVLLVASFLFCVRKVHALDIVGRGIWLTGRALLLSNACKAVLTIQLLLILFSCGELALRALARWLGGPMRPMARLICAGYLGGSQLAVGMVLLGFANGYSRWTLLALTVPLLAAAPFLLAGVAQELVGTALQQCSGQSMFRRGVTVLAVCAVLAAAAALFVNKVLYPEGADGDVWEHYLHYYREVIARGGIRPNDVWYHFYLSKGAGLFFLAIQVSDLWGAQIASFCFLVLAAFVVFDLLRGRAEDPLWGVLGVLLFFLFMLLRNRDVASFSKHHVPILAYLALALWCPLTACRGGDGGQPFERRAVLLTGIVGALYLGFYVPAAAAILVAMVGAGAVCGRLLDRRRFDLWSAGGMAIACVGGAALALAVNYAVTGLPEMVPLRPMWAHVDLPRFDQVWSRYQVEYFFLESEPLSRRAVDLYSLLHVDVDWVRSLCRANYFEPVGLSALKYAVVLALAAAAFRSTSIVASFRELSGQVWRILAFAGCVSGYLLGALVIVQAFPGGESLLRMYTFAAVFLVLCLVAGAAALMAPSPPSRSWWGVLAVAACLWVPVQAALIWGGADPWRYALGEISSVQAIMRVPASPPEIRDRAFLLGRFEDARKLVPPGERLLHLSYDPNPGYLLGGRPVVTEPSYAFDGHYPELLFGPPEQARAILERLHITHVSFYLEARLFLGLPYSQLFSVENLPRHFELVSSREGFYLLRLKDPASPPSALPAELLQLLELYQKPNLSTLCDEESGRRLADEVSQFAAAATEAGQPEAEAVWHALEQRLLAGLTVPENRRELRGLIDQERSRQVVTHPESSGEGVPAERTEQINAEAVQRLRSAVAAWAKERWPPRVCALLLSPTNPTAGAGLYRRMRARYEAETATPPDMR
jgi:hypothetical protein